MTITVTLDGVDVSQYVRVNGVTIDRNLDQRATCRLRFFDRVASWRPLVSSLVEVQSDGATVFKGVLLEVEERCEDNGEQTDALFYDCEAADWHAILERRVVTAVYGQRLPEEEAYQTAESMVDDLVDRYLAADGIDAMYVNAGGIVLPGKFEFELTTAMEALRRIAEAAGMKVYIDFDKHIHLGVFTGTEAPFSLTQDVTDYSRNFRGLKIKRSLRKYRNVQYTQNTTPDYPIRRERFRINATGIVTVSTSFPMESEPYITVDESTEGIGTEWEWAPSYIRSLTSRTFTIDNEIAIEYKTGQAYTVVTRDENEIAARVLADGGSGLWETIDHIAGQDGAAAETTADTLLTQGGGIADSAEFVTHSPNDGLAPGQYILIDTLKPLCNQVFMVDTVSMTEEEMTIWRYRVTCVALTGTDGNARNPVASEWLHGIGRVSSTNPSPAISPESPISPQSPTPINWKRGWLSLDRRAKRDADAVYEIIDFDVAEQITGMAARSMEVGVDVCNPITAQVPGTLARATFIMKEAPEGSAAMVMLKKNGQNIFPSAVQIPDGSTDEVVVTKFVTPNVRVARGDKFTIDVTQVGSGTAGSGLKATLMWTTKTV